MKLICFWCFLLAAVVKAQNEGFYAPQTFRENQNQQQGLFSPARKDVVPQGTTVNEPWRGPAPVNEPWREPNPARPLPNMIAKIEPWRLPYALNKEQQAAILHHKQSLTSDGAFHFEYASDNGLAAGEQIEPDGTRVGAYQYKDPNGQIVKLKYRAGKEGFQILEGSHLPKSPEPVPPSTGDNYYNQAYQQQKQQYTLQQQYNQQKQEPQQQKWEQNKGPAGPQNVKNGQFFVSNWNGPNGVDDGQYQDSGYVADPTKPHNFGAGYAFSFQG